MNKSVDKTRVSGQAESVGGKNSPTAVAAPDSEKWLQKLGVPDSRTPYTCVRASELLRLYAQGVLEAAADAIEASEIHGVGGAHNSYEQRRLAAKIAAYLRGTATKASEVLGASSGSPEKGAK